MPIEVGEGESVGGSFEASHVAVGPKHPHFSFVVAVGFHALEALDAVVQTRTEGVQFEVFEGGQLGLAPSFFGVPVDGDHVVGVVLAEEEGGGVECGLGEEAVPEVSLEVGGLAGEGGTLKVVPVVERSGLAG